MPEARKLIVHMIGNAHIDPVWLWPWQAGLDEVLATFRSAADRCDEYPDFIFTRGEAWCYDQVERVDPALFDRVRALVENGQWHVTGGQWIQPDVNLPTLAGLRRQITHGHRYFNDRFGVAPRVGYNVDSFGHPATLPDLLAAHDYDGYVFHRPSQKQTALPAATFRWVGPGGGEVMGFRIPMPYTTRTHDLYGQVMLAADGADRDLGHVMCFYGVGNHGGGPTKGNIEYVLANRDSFDGMELVFSTPQAFFDAVKPKRETLPVVGPDLELQRTFPGCYVVMSDVKRDQFRGEHRLEQAVDAVDAMADPADRPGMHEKLDAAWADLLFTEFHDILAGTSIGSAWASVRGFQGRARVAGEEVVAHVTRRWARANLPAVNHQQIAVINPGGAPFDGLVEHGPSLDFDAWGGRWLAAQDGGAVPFQLVQPESTIMLTPAVLFPLKVPAGGAGVVVMRDDANPSPAAFATDLDVSPTHLSNGRVRLDLTPDGVGRVTLDGADALGGSGGNAIALRLREDLADTWGFQIDRFDGPITDRLTGLTWAVEESGLLRARVRAEGVSGRSPVRWTISLHAGEPVVRVAVDIVCSERHRLLQMPLGLPGTVESWRAGLAGGAVTRQTSPVEWPMHGWGRIDRPGGASVAVVTPDAYSSSCDNAEGGGASWAWSLLRTPRMAWSGADTTDVFSGRVEFTDQGAHRFEFELRLSAAPGDLPDAALEAASHRMARPPIVFDRYDGMSRPPWGDNPPRRLWTGAEQRARADGRMPHLADDDSARGVEEA